MAGIAKNDDYPIILIRNNDAVAVYNAWLQSPPCISHDGERILPKIGALA